MKKQIPRIVSIIILLVIYAFAKPEQLNTEELEDLAKDFSFEKHELYSPKGIEPIYIRNTHPQYKNIAGWVSSVGASIAFFDYDKDGLYNDIVHVDPRFNSVSIYSSPTTKERFKPFQLDIKGLDKTMAPSGVLVYDFNEDGSEDILVYFLGRTPLIFYNTKEGFEQVELYNNVKEEWDSTSGTIADFNGDGHPDIFIANYFPEGTKLLHSQATDNDQVMQHSMSRADNGGRNKIFLWKGVKEGKAIYVENKEWDNGMKLKNGWTLAVAAGDLLNNDLLPELYIANDFGPDNILLNTTLNNKLSFQELKGQRKFFTTRSNVIGEDSFKGMGADFNDINNDGLLDIYVSNIADSYALHESHFVFVNTGKIQDYKKGIAPYSNESEPLGLSRSSWGWEAKLGDFNNDGIMEALQATGFIKGEVDRWAELQELATTNDELISNPKYWPNVKEGDDLSGNRKNTHPYFFTRNKKGKYYDISAQIGLNYNKVTRGIALSDVDHDGMMDLAIVSQWDKSYFFKNKGVTQNKYIGISVKIPIEEKLNKIQINGKKLLSRDAIGAVIKINLKNGEKIIKYVDGGNGHSGRNSKEIIIGLGNTVSQNEIVDMEIFWRKSDSTVNKDKIKLHANNWHTIYLPF